ncbi:MAG: glycine cleavage system protein H [Gammaproteobacteria bacterium RIFCSPHIGHO2_12_FULL_38_11]|nr:MAG: glycine cleavage system protein H [Gammaproteobacteria bacterium RIFCSPHIGHO2_12_FULL_38_11]
MTDCPRELHYTESHEWVRLENDDTVVVGITDHAQHQLGDLVFVELPDMNLSMDQGDEMTVVESVKTAADVYAPISGEIVEVNPQLESRPELINQDPYGNGWICRIKPSNIEELDELLDADAYKESIADSEE